MDLFLVSKENITQELKNAQLMGIRVELEEFISQRLRKHYGIPVHWPDNSAREILEGLGPEEASHMLVRSATV